MAWFVETHPDFELSPYTLPGLWFALAFTCLSFTPSLLPRPWFLQGVVAGLTAVLGYAIGTAIGALVRRTPLIVTYHLDLWLPRGLVNAVAVRAVQASTAYTLKRAAAVVVSSEDHARSTSQYRLLQRLGYQAVPPPCADRRLSTGTHGLFCAHCSGITGWPSRCM